MAKKQQRRKPKQIHVVIPEARYRVVEFEQQNLPGIAVVNSILDDFEPKSVFPWQLELTLQCRELAGKRLPVEQEREVVEAYAAELHRIIWGTDPTKPNSILLARITWNSLRELVYRVHEPKAIHDYLQECLQIETDVRHFTYDLKYDPDWLMAKWHLSLGSE